MGGTGQGRWFVRQCPVSLPTGFEYGNLILSQGVEWRPELSRYFTGRGTRHPRPVPPIYALLQISGTTGTVGPRVLRFLFHPLNNAAKLWTPDDCIDYHYGAFTIAYANRIPLQRYIATQRQHHQNLSFRDKLLALLEGNGVAYDPRYLD